MEELKSVDWLDVREIEDNISIWNGDSNVFFGRNSIKRVLIGKYTILLRTENSEITFTKSGNMYIILFA